MLKQTLKITTLGNFSVSLGDKVLTGKSKRVQRIWTIFKYIITYREKLIPPEEFFDVVWEDESCENPAHALQNLIYRLRTALVAEGGGSDEYILNRHGCYCWNREADYKLDVEEFEKNIKLAKESDNAGNRDSIKNYLDALDAYQSDYLPESVYTNWTIPARNYYRRLYTDGVIRAADILLSEERYSDIIRICEAAAQIDPYDETVHARMILAYSGMGKIINAKSHYEYVSSMLYRELGIKPSKELRDAYRRINDRSLDVQMDLSSVQEIIVQSDTAREAFYCDSDVFRMMYNLEARRLQRSGDSVFVALFTIMTTSYSMPDTETLLRAMKTLTRVLLGTLRKGDVVSKWSDSQGIVLLNSLTYEDGEKVIARLTKKFEAEYIGPRVIVKTSLAPVVAEGLRLSKTYGGK
ncbi:MAG: AfsR/SARP family transcriptional regulator [Christensenellales bacterium]